jgi:hypothetical protein
MLEALTLNRVITTVPVTTHPLVALLPTPIPTITPTPMGVTTTPIQMVLPTTTMGRVDLPTIRVGLRNEGLIWVGRYGGDTMSERER